MPLIIVDHRERDSRIITELIKRDIEVEERALDVADFIIRTKGLDGKVKEIGIERKTKNDLLNSIIDKRIINQLSSLKKNFEVPLLIIEGSENIYQIRNFHPNAIRGMMASIAIDYQIPIIYTRNYRDTAALLSVIAKRLEKQRSNISLLKKRKPSTLKEQQELVVETFPGIGPILAKGLLGRFKTIEGIVSASEIELKRVEKIGKKKAKQIKHLVSAKYL